jgi:hypothetical protein
MLGLSRGRDGPAGDNEATSHEAVVGEGDLEIEDLALFTAELIAVEAVGGFRGIMTVSTATDANDRRRFDFATW